MNICACVEDTMGTKVKLYDTLESPLNPHMIICAYAHMRRGSLKFVRGGA